MTQSQIVILLIWSAVLQFAHGRSGGIRYNDVEIRGSGDGEDTCTPEYRDADGPLHTMCFTDDARVLRAGVSNIEEREIVDYHNKVRSEVRPKATDLQKLVWDDKLAAVAEKWAKQCLMDHDKNRNIPSYGISVGQNVAGGYMSWAKAMQGWFDEVKMYKFGLDPEKYLGQDGFAKIGHYTQMVSNTTNRVGCGFSECSNTRYGRYYVCNYASSQMSPDFPYTNGKQCAACPQSCRNGLCDCGGKLCKNRGSLDLNTCRCKCELPYTGETCGELDCPVKDKSFCGTQYPKSYCQRYVNVPNECPYMCGICGSSAQDNNGGDYGDNGSALTTTPPRVTSTRRTKTTTTPGPYLSPHNCTYRGERASLGQCKMYGDHGQDMNFCESRGGSFTCSDCDTYYNVKTAYCPVMCGLCDGPCGGKVCQHRGKLDLKTCQCECEKPYSGATCETLACPDEDEWYCITFPPEYCDTYVNIPSDCPHLCKIC